ncbi:nuclear transport factor 2 family protein [Nocardioides sp. zg-DK7169]|uniref:nuclear transport factor 2 family protein n=1 Tax=Nocardioides sp. zg-DK7169 TaxID=2736600 RepID=UPI00155224B0|nr:nuclear transport factor 2 family protein [Nocardioides sp. zg-DK7169]NPC98649.1 nuclear transport factor 2 family protein [Nocardioides sp. zg-DK7169]
MSAETPSPESTGPRVPRSVALRPALSDLVHRYAALGDLRRPGQLAALFAADGQLVVPTPPDRLDPHRVLAGPRQIGEHLAVLEELTLTVHQIVGEVYDVPASAEPASTAAGRVACVANHLSGERNVVWHLHYDDRYVREGERWLFARRELHIDFIETRQVRRHR